MMIVTIGTVSARTVDVAPTNSGDINITNLTFYDRDNNGILSKQEIEVVITDCYKMRITDPQIDCLIEILGYYPLIGTMPAVKTPRVVVTIDTDDIWYPEGSIVADDVIINGNENQFHWNHQDPIGIDTDTMTINGNRNGNRNWVVTNTNTLTINGNKNFVWVVNRYIESVTITGNYNYIAIPKDSTPTIDNTGEFNHVENYTPWW